MTVTSSDMPNDENNDDSIQKGPIDIQKQPAVAPLKKSLSFADAAHLQNPSSFDDATRQQIERLAERINDCFSTSVGRDYYGTEYLEIVRDHMIKEFPDDFNPITRDFDSSRTGELQRFEWELISWEVRPTLYFPHEHRPGKVGVKAFGKQVSKFLKKSFRLGWFNLT